MVVWISFKPIYIGRIGHHSIIQELNQDINLPVLIVARIIQAMSFFRSEIAVSLETEIQPNKKILGM